MRRISYLALGMALAATLGLAVAISLPGGANAAVPAGRATSAGLLGACGIPGPWTTVSPIPTAVFGAMVASDGTYVYAAGGYSFQTPGATSQFYRYDRAADTWAPLANLPAAVYDGAAAYANGHVYVVGGTNGSTVFTTTYIYDIATNTWTTGASLPAPREQMGIGYAAGRIYIVGGSDGQEINPQSTLYSYDTTAGTWTTSAPLPQAVAGPGSGVVNGHLYIAGGRDVSTPNRTTVYDYNIASNSWTTAAPLLTGVNVPGSAVAGGAFIVFGGGNPFSKSQVPFTTGATQVYDPGSNTWTPGPNLNTARSFVGGAAVGNYLVAVGGYNGSTSLNSVEVSFVPCGSPTPTGTTGATNTATSTSTPTSTGVATNTSTPTGVATHTSTPTGVATHTSTPTGTGVVGTSTSTPTGTRLATGTSTPTSGTGTPVSTETSTPTGGSPTVTSTPCTINFSDVQPSDYFYNDVRCVYCLGAVSGYADGTFRPFNNTTRGQMTKIITIALNIPIATPTGTPTFSDVPPGSPFYDYVETLAALNIVSGYADGTFRPNTFITRGQLSKIDAVAANHVFGWELLNPPTQTFSDVPPGSPFYEYIETVHCHNVVSGYSDGTFRPGNNAIRAQIAKIVCATSQNPPDQCSPTATPDLR